MLRSMAANPFVDPRSACDRASVVALVEVVESGETRVTVEAMELLRSPKDTRSTLSVRQGLWNPEVGDRFYLFVSEGDEALYATRSRREVLRLLAGLPPDDPTPDTEQLLRLYQSADAVVEGTAYARGETSALLRVDRVDKGALLAVPIDSDTRVQITIGYTTTDPGGPWSFSTSEFMTTRGFVGWFFLKHRADGTWSVENPLHPALLTRLEIERIHSVLDRP